MRRLNLRSLLSSRSTNVHRHRHTYYWLHYQEVWSSEGSDPLCVEEIETVIDMFSRLAKERHQYAKDWKQNTGGKVFGYFCTLVPEEIIYAAGILPVRILGSSEPEDLTSSYIPNYFCPYCRDCTAEGLRGRYDYLDGITKARACLHIRNAYGVWARELSPSYSYYISMPRSVQSPRAKPFLRSEYALFQRSLEEWTGNKVTPEALDDAITAYNNNRRLLGQLYDLRKSPDPVISGADTMEVVLSSQTTDKKEHNQLLTQLLAGLSQKKGLGMPGPRLMIVGSCQYDIGFFRLVESLGSIVVTDDLCTGTRYFLNEVSPGQDRLEAIAERYLSKPPCPLRDIEEHLRGPHILRLIKDYDVQGVILVQKKFCDPHAFDIPYLQRLLKKEANIPTLFLEDDITVPVGQFKTRIEAFLEVLELELV